MTRIDKLIVAILTEAEDLQTCFAFHGQKIPSKGTSEVFLEEGLESPNMNSGIASPLRPSTHRPQNQPLSLKGFQSPLDLGSPQGRRVKTSNFTEVKRKVINDMIPVHMRSAVAKYAVSSIVPELEDASLIEAKVKGETVLDCLQRTFLSSMKKAFQLIQATKRVGDSSRLRSLDDINLNYSESPENREDAYTSQDECQYSHLGDRRNFSKLVLNCLSPFSPTRKTKEKDKLLDDEPELPNQRKNESFLNLLSPSPKKTEHKREKVSSVKFSTLLESPTTKKEVTKPAGDPQTLAAEQRKISPKMETRIKSTSDPFNILSYYTSRTVKNGRKSIQSSEKQEMFTVGCNSVRDTARRLNDLNKELQHSIESNRSSYRNPAKAKKNSLLQLVKQGHRDQNKKQKRENMQECTGIKCKYQNVTSPSNKMKREPIAKGVLLKPDLELRAYLTNRMKTKLLLRHNRESPQRSTMAPSSAHHTRQASGAFSKDSRGCCENYRSNNRADQFR